MGLLLWEISETVDAFDNTTFQSMCKIAEEYWMEEEVMIWICAMLGSW
jgi:hypothetical protein